MRGSYLLLVELKENNVLRIGKLNKILFNKGFYVYVGSALNGLEQRVQRHLRKQKKMHWHIDSLLRHAKIINIFYKENNAREECNIAKILDKKLLSVSDFGCSDCTCKSHLFYGSLEEIMPAIEKLQMQPYQLNANA